MKRLATVIAAMMMIGVVAVFSLLAQNLAGVRDSETGGEPVNDGEYSYRQYWQEHLAEVEPLERQLAAERREMAAMLLQSEQVPLEELLLKQKKIQKLQNELQREKLVFHWELRKRFPDIVIDIGDTLPPEIVLEPSSKSLDYYDYEVLPPEVLQQLKPQEFKKRH